ncbi:MAG: hypothetical protein LUF32_09270 [Clostridiales bacterium]|nr:hypothetical protein [Clostridiales bacterium]
MSNQEYKSDVFSMLLEDPENALSVYNALNHTDYRDPSEVRIFRLEAGIQLSIRNDASFIIDSCLSIYEHQSTPNPNMPLRFLIYITELYKTLTKNRDLFSSTLRKIPRPSFVVFYNGRDKEPEVKYIKLSDAFECPAAKPELELVCTLYNINPGYNQEIINKCKVLKEYTEFVDRVRGFRDMYLLDKALDAAIDSCIRDHILEKFLRENRAEVKRVSTLDYTFERRLQLQREENQEIVEQLTSEKEQLTSEKEQLASEVERMRKLLAAHGIQEE